MSNIIDSIQLSGVTYTLQGSGGGTTYTAGRGIDITSDTISVSLPISAGTGTNSIAEGVGTVASGNRSHAEGYNTTASGNTSHAEGYQTVANGDYGSHAEGWNAHANGSISHAEGYNTTASGDTSHAEGNQTVANGNTSHAEGVGTTANGNTSHAEGNNTKANGNISHAEGIRTIANNEAEHASGSYNVSNKANTTWGDSGNTLFSVGNGTADNARHNAFEIRQNGDIYLSSGGTDIKLQDHLGGGGGGKAIEAGRGIAITTGATADTVSFNLPISAGTGTSGTYIAIGVNAYAQEGYNSFLSNAGGISIGSGSSANRNSIIIGNGAADDKDRGHGISIGTGAKSKYGSISIGEFSESSGTSYEEKSSIAIGYRTTAKNVIKALAIGTDVRTTGTTKTNINNQLTIDTSNQVYISNSANTSTYCLQEKIENTETALGGLKLVKLSQSEYDNLATKDNSTLYVIVN